MNGLSVAIGPVLGSFWYLGFPVGNQLVAFILQKQEPEKIRLETPLKHEKNCVFAYFRVIRIVISQNHEQIYKK